jgi:hypothetical protein
MDNILPYDLPEPQGSNLRWDQKWELKYLSKQFHDIVHGSQLKDPAAAFARSWESAKRNTQTRRKEQEQLAAKATHSYKLIRNRFGGYSLDDLVNSVGNLKVATGGGGYQVKKY